MSLGIHTSRCRALGHDHDEARTRDPNQQLHVVPVHRRQGKVRQSAGHGSNRSDTVRGKIQELTCGNGGDHRDQRTGNLRARPRQQQARPRSRRVKLPASASRTCSEVVQDFVQLQQRSMRMNLQPQHLAEHRNANLKSNAGEKADQHGLREEICEKSKLQQPCQQAGKQRSARRPRWPAERSARYRWAPIRPARRREWLRSPNRRQRPGSVKNQRGERDRRKQQRVEAGDHRRAGDLGIAQRLRDIHRRQLEAGEGVADSPCPLQRAHALKQIRPGRCALASFTG